MDIEDLKEDDIVKDPSNGTYYKITSIGLFGSIGTIIKCKEMFKSGMGLEKDLFPSECYSVTTQEVAQKVLKELTGD